MAVIHSMSFIWSKRRMKTKKMKMKRKKNAYVKFFASFFENMFENVEEHSRLFRVSRFDRCPACDSFETDFVDGTVLSIPEL